MDDILVLSHNPGQILAHLSEYYSLKDGYSKPERYLRAQVKEWRSPNDPTKTKWALSLEQYVKEAVKNVVHELQKQNKFLKCHKQPYIHRIITPMSWTLLLY